MKDEFFFIKNTTWDLIKRMSIRSVVLALLCVIGFSALEQLVQIGMANPQGMIQKFPELLSLVKATTIFMFLEISLFWIRLATAPKVDVQASLETANATSIGAAIVYFTNVLQWFARVCVFLYLAGPLS
jgi:hypothetical protein